LPDTPPCISRKIEELMRNSLDGTATGEQGHNSAAEPNGTREVVIPHDPKAGPVSAVRNVLLQSSLGNLKASGYYDRYVQLIAPELLAQLLSSLGPGWIPVELASAHYEACENLMLSARELAKVGSQVGDRLQETALVSSAKKARDADFDLWEALSSLHRMWGRLYQGGSVQVVKLGAREKLLELRGFSLTRFHYFRQATLTAIGASYSALGPRMTSVRIQSYSPKTHEMVVRSSW
jgi:hypothetical protein